MPCPCLRASAVDCREKRVEQRSGDRNDLCGRLVSLLKADQIRRFLIEISPVIDFGLPNASMHKVGEHARVEDIENLTRIYRRVIEKVFA